MNSTKFLHLKYQCYISSKELAMSDFTCHKLNPQKRHRPHNLECSLSVTMPPLKQQKKLFNLQSPNTKKEKSILPQHVSTPIQSKTSQETCGISFSSPQILQKKTTPELVHSYLQQETSTSNVKSPQSSKGSSFQQHTQMEECIIHKPTYLAEVIQKSTMQTTSRNLTQTNGKQNCKSTNREMPVKLQQPIITRDLPKESEKKLYLSKDSDNNGQNSSKDVKKILLEENSSPINYELVQLDKMTENTQIPILNANQEGNQNKIPLHLHLKEEEGNLVKPVTSTNQAKLLDNPLKNGNKNYDVSVYISL